MSETYCPLCQRMTATHEEVLTSSYLNVCAECGTVREDSPIENPGSSGEGFEQRECNTQHWTLSLRGSVGTNHAQLQLLRKEDSLAGRAFRRHQSDAASPLYSQTSALLTSLCDKLNLEENTRKRIREIWYSIRGPRGLTGVHVERNISPFMGVACLYWVCREEGRKISPSRLAVLAEIKKSTFLQASLKVEKVLGFPVSGQYSTSVRLID